VNEFLRGAVAMASFAVGLFFLRYFRTSRDRLFLLFCVAFWLFALNWTVIALAPALAPHAYWLRFSAFAIIALAVIDKNRRQNH
jgi:hypothetical protein